MLRREFLGSLAALPILGFAGKTKGINKDFKYTHYLDGQPIIGAIQPLAKYINRSWFGYPEHQMVKDKNQEYKFVTFPIEARLNIVEIDQGGEITYSYETFNMKLSTAKLIQQLNTKYICDKIGYMNGYGESVKFEEKYWKTLQDKNLELVLFGQKFKLNNINFGVKNVIKN